MNVIKKKKRKEKKLPRNSKLYQTWKFKGPPIWGYFIIL